MHTFRLFHLPATIALSQVRYNSSVTRPCNDFAIGIPPASFNHRSKPFPHAAQSFCSRKNDFANLIHFGLNSLSASLNRHGLPRVGSCFSSLHAFIPVLSLPPQSPLLPTSIPPPRCQTPSPFHSLSPSLYLMLTFRPPFRSYFSSYPHRHHPHFPIPFPIRPVHVTGRYCGALPPL